MVPADVGQTVNGFQDDFDGPALNLNWLAVGAASGIYQVTNGVLKVSSTIGDPNHLLYAVSGYDSTVQEVLARIRITDFGQGDAARAGVAVGVDPASSQGINYHFRNVDSEGQTGHHTSFLDDMRHWGSGYAFPWDNNVWYWVRLRQEPNASAQGGVNDVFAKVWLADGTAPEPATWQVWDYTPASSTRLGYAGITAGSSGGLAEFEVDYILIKAVGFPSIVVAPKAFPLTQQPAVISTQPQSQTVEELSPVTFTIGTDGNPAPVCQWYRNDQSIPNATNTNFTLASVRLSDDQASFKATARNLVSNQTYTATSQAAILTVIADTNPPVLLSATAIGLSQVQVAFSESLEPASAQDSTHFQITNQIGPLKILQATLDATQTNVLLEVAPMSEGMVYTLTVNQVVDQAAARNAVLPNSRTTFAAVSYQPYNIGNPLPVGTIFPMPGGYDLAAGGADIGGTSDQCFCASLGQNGDFDLQVRLANIDTADLWAKAGLIARETANPNSAFVGIFGTSGNVGAYFESRSSTGAAAALSGYFPVNYPGTWLRLKRMGNQFTGYAGYDGLTWTKIGDINVPLASGLEVGLAVCGHGQGQTATAHFRDLSPGSSTILSASPSPYEPLAQSSRRTPIVISEIMYDSPQQITNELEFVELYNAFGTPEDISGYRLAGDIDYTFPANTILPGGGFLVVARNPNDVQSYYGITNILGPYIGALSNGGGTLQLRHRTGAVFLEINFHNSEPWPVAAHGLGHSLVLARPSFGENAPRAWAASDQVGGSPGRADSYGFEPLRGVVINEFLAHTDELLLDFIELHNHNNTAADISGCWLTDGRNALSGAAATRVFRVPTNTVIPPRGFVVFDQYQLGFALKAEGEMIALFNADRTRVLDAVTFTGQALGISRGRVPDGAPDFYPLATRTPGAANSFARVNDMVINEIMYNPISGENADEYVELYNQGSTAIEVGGWQFTQGIKFQIPAGMVVPPDGYLVIAKSITNLLARYPGTLTTNNTTGDYSGSLADGGERLALAAPDFVISTNSHGVITTNYFWCDVDEVTYSGGGRWGQWSAGGGSSLELIDPRSDHRRAPNWADSDESAKAPWTLASYSGTLDNGDVAADELQVLLQGPGECLIDDVEVLNASGINQVANSTFESGASGWVAEGTEQRSSLETAGGYNGGQCYHVRADDRGDNQVNRIRTVLKSALVPGTTATIRAKVRWLKGHPEILFRLRGKWLEAAVIMTLPSNLGTPGARNSRFAPNAPPAIFEVAHTPVLPGAGEAVLVTARLADPDGIASVTLNYRVDPSPTLRGVPMVDDGTGGDVIAGDGIYSATIPGQPAGTLVAYQIKATDAHAIPAFSVFPNDAPLRECLVRFGEPVQPGNIPVYRMWMTQATFNTWTSRAKLNNTPLDITFVLGNQRVIYNVQAMYAGSPYISPGYSTPSGNRCGYSLTFPTDDQFLGNVDLVLDWPGGHGNENTGIQEEMAYWIGDQLNIPFCLRHFIRLIVNGVTDMQRGGVFEAINQPARDYVKAWSPDDSGGDFYKIERGYEFSDGGGVVADPMPRLQNYTTTGGLKKTSRYRWNWLKRSYLSANNYTNIFNLVDAVNAASPEPYTTGTEQLVEIEEWMRVFAFDHIINNFDSWGHEIGKNMYAYKPQFGKWQIYPFDLDWLMLVSPLYSSRYANGNGPLFIGEDPTVVRMYNHPPFERAYYRAVQDAVDKPLASAYCDPVMDAKYNWLVANGVTLCDGAQLVGPATVKKWFSDRRRVLQTQLAQVAANFTVTTPTATLTNNNLATLTGTAPITIKTIQVNGAVYEPVWTTVSNYTFQVPLVNEGTNLLRVQGYDLRGQAVTNASAFLTISYQGTAPRLLDCSFGTNGVVTLRWSAIPAMTYQLQYKDDLSANAWVNLGSTILADTNTVVTFDPQSGLNHRFYRVILVQ